MLCSVTSVMSDSLPLRAQRPLQSGRTLREESPPSGQEKCTHLKTPGREISGRSSSVCICYVVFQPCPTLCNTTDCSLPGSFVHGILQARILEWVTMPSSRGSSPPRDRTQVSPIAGRFFTDWALGDLKMFTSEPRVHRGKIT